GVNWVHRRFRCNYIVLRNVTLAREAYESGSSLILSEQFMGRQDAAPNLVPFMAWFFPHLNRNLHAPLDLSVIGTERIAVGVSIIVSALHVSAYLGARNIIVCGHDCGSLDGEIAFKGYYDQIDNIITKWRLLKRMEEQTVAVREKLFEVFGCRMYSLNPF